MNKAAVALLQKHFDLVLDAPDGIKRLRELTLTLAMQGKLVPQDPKDQPASELLKEIDEEKKRLVKEGKIRATQPLPGGKPEDLPYAVPKGWEWVNFDGICSIITQGPNPKYTDKGTPNFRVLKTKDFYDDRILYEKMECIEQSLFEEYSKYQLVDSDIIFGLVGRGSTAKCNIFFEQPGIKCIFTRATGLLRLVNTTIVYPQLIHYFFRSSYGKRKTNEITDGSTGQLVIRTSELKKMVFPLPPLAEQKRIIAKIDQLMASCDALEKLRNNRQQIRLNIHTTAITRLLDVKQPDEAKAAWAFLQEHFIELYSIKENVAELRKVILQLAVMGKLVSQDPRDQPASELLKEIEAEKKRLVKEGKIKAPKPLPEIKPEDVPYAVPGGWEWVRLGAIGETNIGLTYSPANISDSGIPVLRSSNVQKGLLDFTDIVRVQMDLKESVMVQDSDLLICARNGSKALVGKTAMIKGLNEPMAFGAFMAIFRSRFNHYLLLFINSPLFRQMIDEVNTMTINQITQENLRNTVFPLPPFAEQKRIVAKIDQLMALCDNLEQGIEAASKKQNAILDAVVAQV